ncbi:MAG: AraC family transcriptional regulator [Paracoccaceae bacterium]
MDQIIVETISTATIAIALFGVVLCLMQTEYVRVSRSLASFLAAVTVSNLPDAISRFRGASENILSLSADLIIWFPSLLFLAPLFWIYVVTLTSTAQRRPSHLYRHFLLPALAALIGLIITLSPQNIETALLFDGTLPTSGWPLALVTLVVLLQIALYPQMAIYVVLTVRRMMRYRLMLRDFYASTEEHELRWIVVIGGLAALYWLARALFFFVVADSGMIGVATALLTLTGLSSLAFVATLTLWGLRQRPPLVPDIEDKKPLVAANDQPAEKYEKSALSSEASTRIAKKLRAAMEQDNLHRDPNLSLWALARHIGASPNYISQTLNEVIGESFFDFVNRYRIVEAEKLLSTTDATVLTITYDVGFNARSSFYNAFKRVTGQTPTDYRKKMSLRDGMDDMTG